MDDASSYSRLIGPIEHQMLATVWRMLRNSHDAEDALHNALTVLWEQWHAVKCHPNPHALILKVCANAAIDHLRRRNQWDRHEHLDPRYESVPSRQLAPPDAAIRNETLESVMAAIARLSDHQSVAVAMRIVQGATYESIAAALGCSAATARTHVTRGREKLGELLYHLDPNSIPERAP